MDFVNLSAEPLGKLYSWIPHDLRADKIVFLPDACAGKSPLPTGTAVLTRQKDWRKFAVSDCGCGMRFLKSDLCLDNLKREDWDRLADTLRSCKGGLGDLGGGNHFLDALVPLSGGSLHFLVHTGSRSESGLVDSLVDEPQAFDRELRRVIQWAADNRAKVQESVESVFGHTEVVLDLPHNTYEELPDHSVVIRKGSVRVRPGDLNIIPSHMSGDVMLVRTSDRAEETLFSLSHGTGRTMSRGDCKPLADKYDFASMRERVMVASGIENSSLRTDGPYVYRDLDECLALMNGYVEEVSRFRVVAYMGHLCPPNRWDDSGITRPHPLGGLLK